uniref:ATP synthase F0 subunit 6 n=1 Tax=Krisna furcata TaxID=1962556 RepID=UPI0025520BA5|nr:ATP synthase F0 subunit 6 [Krisna furcata]WGG89424.1 ATP synthase F0 subunit 6 [Krisna furcata]
MMTNLFSSFDPCTGLLSMNWLSTILILIILPMNMWLIPNNNMIILNNLMMYVNKELKSNLISKPASILMISIFMFILINNTTGLIPYIFTSSSQLVFSLTLSLPMWTSFIIFKMINKTNLLFSHMVPYGTPTILMPFMVIIETISNLIRPGSLAVRLSANMIAGHMLMSLLGNMNKMMMPIMMTIFIILMMFELAVAMIQSYVFMTLTSLYCSE